MPRHVPVLDRKVRFVGDAVAIVAAETEEIANEALDVIDVEYDQLPAVYDVEEAMKADAPQLHDDFPGNLVAGFPVFGTKTLSEVVIGDVEKGFEEADIISEGTYGYETIANPLSIEPPGVIARWEDEHRLTVWSGTPVKVSYSREEQFGAFVLRLGSRFRGRIGIKKDGTVTAVSGVWFVDAGAFSDMAQAQVAVGCGEAQLMLRCPNWDLRTRLVCTNHSASGVVRGFGGQELESALSPLLAQAMERANLDPVQFYKKNYVKPGDGYFWREGNYWVSRGRDYSEAIDRGALAFGWKEKWKGWLKPTAVDGARRTGVGVGVHGNADVGEDESEAYVRLNPDATATIHVSVSESGMGQRSSLCKMAAEVLQLPLECIHVTPADTMVNPFDFGLVGSRGTYAVGSAVIRAAEDARKKLLELAAPKLEAAPEDLETMDGRIYRKERLEEGIPWSRAMGIMQTCMGFGRF
jgi:CO/xanthine dehydrogenase Mo-binding subunit